MTTEQQKKRILVIDDSETIRRTVELILSKENFEVGVAEDGFQAFSAIIEFKPDIIFLDIIMPRLDGYQVCSIVKNNPEFKHIPIIMLSSKDSAFDKARGSISGADYFMAKPFSREDLLLTINKQLNLN